VLFVYLRHLFGEATVRTGVYGSGQTFYRCFYRRIRGFKGFGEGFCYDISLFKGSIAGLPLTCTEAGAPGYKAMGRSHLHGSRTINSINLPSCSCALPVNLDSFPYGHRIQLFPTFIVVPATRLRATPTCCLWFWVLFLPLSNSRACADLPIALAIVHCNDTSILSLHSRCILSQVTGGKGRTITT
jgi:hypothetical protein